MLNEMWKDIPDFEGLYQISNLGRIRSLGRVVAFANHERYVTTKVLQPVLNNGYYRVTLSKNEIRKACIRGRMMALAFIPNPLNLPFINHINGIKTDDRLENIEWVTISYNTQHAYDMGLCSKNLAVIAINRSTKEERVYASYSKAAQDLRLEPSSISRAAAGKANHVNNWRFYKMVTRQVLPVNVLPELIKI